MSSSALFKIYIQFTKFKCSKNYMVLCNPFPGSSFTVKKTKILIKIMWRNYLAIKNYLIQYKLQYGGIKLIGNKMTYY